MTYLSSNMPFGVISCLFANQHESRAMPSRFCSRALSFYLYAMVLTADKQAPHQCWIRIKTMCLVMTGLSNSFNCHTFPTHKYHARKHELSIDSSFSAFLTYENGFNTVQQKYGCWWLATFSYYIYSIHKSSWTSPFTYFYSFPMMINEWGMIWMIATVLTGRLQWEKKRKKN